ncbi:amino acid carrier protein [Gleimia coleocanis DSM 15436]|uniref:Amino acid carrier protein n=1 Tax=Gleimia coleocanis DSM 15436 TaxID=525245 RepID=C0W150_9ACTO|nr:alanine/glycine:cation symporter family protein [Gleimia coleocanis]EEH63539.1 amino acid carrier protein [Gleimia coleocanis DSM 15436]
MINTILKALTDALNVSVGFLYSWVLLFLLVGVGVYLTFFLNFPQFRNIKDIFTSLNGSRTSSGTGMSSFQAFTIGVGTRVGVGNIIGVALALILGGPGAIFWMWVVALLGMSTSYAESVLAQVFKVRQADGTFRGGPADYMTRGLGWKLPATLFAVFAVIATGLAVPMVQVNTISATLETSHNIPTWASMLLMFTLLAPVILGGMRSIARVSEFLAPFMAGAYLLITVVVIALHPQAAWNALVLILESAFGFGPVSGGIVGGVFTALVNGVRRGLFSNEAGLGTTPHVAGSATVLHPAEQGWVQSLGVFVDTMIVCTTTALLILVSGVYHPGLEAEAAGGLTAVAVTTVLGDWMALPVSFIILIFGYTSAYGAYYYGQVALSHLTSSKPVVWIFRAVSVVVASSGAMVALPTAWALSDLLLGLGALINLTAVILLAKYARLVLHDWNKRKSEGRTLVFDASIYPELKDVYQG